MDHFQHIMVMGAGAVGGYFGGCIAQGTSAEVSLIARGAHLEAIQDKGLIIRDKQGELRININGYDKPDKAPEPDLVLFTVKSHDTEKAIQQIRPTITERTQLLTLQNGIENYSKLIEAFGEDRVTQGFCKIGAGVTEPGIVEHRAFGSITIGEQGGNTTKRIRWLKELFEQAQVPVQLSDHIKREVWLKFTWNCILNMVTAAGNVTVEKIFDYEEGEQLCYRLFEEIQLIAGLEGIRLKDSEGAEIIESSKTLTGFETSTYQDRRSGKKMEYEAFTGALVRLAEEHGVQVPHNETLYAILKLVDRGREV